MNEARKPLTKVQIGVLTAAFVPMLATGVIGGIGTYSNIGHAYGTGTALGALGAGEGATAVLALVLLGLTMLGQSSPRVVRIGLWALPAAAAVMGAMAAPDLGRTVIYALTPMGMSVSAEGMAFLARRIVVHTDGRDAENERRTADIVQALAYHRARAAHHPVDRVRKRSDRASWRLARKVGVGDAALGSRLLDVQRDRITDGADAALASMFGGTAPALAPIPDADANAEESTENMRNRSTADLRESTPAPSVVLTRFSVPDPVAVDFVKPTLPLKPVPSIAPAVDPVKADPAPTGRRAVAADSPRSRRATGRVPEVARSPRPKRTTEQLLAEARTATADWPADRITAEGIRRTVRTSPANARMLRDTILAERGEGGGKAA
ncbi:conjugal transfer protein [Streptomyces sp. NPDC004959]|uniref:conjugal transfer protein n=1 Tax=Streptomyces sp. NPDC004959 TaxID=3154673 RepID=UPI0033A59633